MEPLTVMRAAAGWPLTVSLSLLPPTKGTEMHAPATWQAATDGIFFAAVYQAHRPTGLVAKLNSFHSYKPHDSGLSGGIILG